MATVDWAGVADKWKGMFVVALKKVGCFIALGLPPAPASDPPPVLSTMADWQHHSSSERERP